VVPRFIAVAAAALLASGCNDIRYQAARLRAKAPPLEVPKLAALPDRRAIYDCKDGEPFDVYFPAGGVGAALTIGGEDFALRAIETVVGKRFGDEHFELYMKEDGTADLTVDEKSIRSGCRRR
jgi:hypothetical protein